MVKTLADVKRRAQVGALLRLVYEDGHRVLERRGNPPDRRIVVRQTNAIAFEACEWSQGRMSWMWWPKAAEVTVDGDTFHVAGLGTYTFLEDAPEPGTG